jgi:hypothetical protein
MRNNAVAPPSPLLPVFNFQWRSRRNFFFFNLFFWSFAFMCELCTILYLLAKISHDRIYQPCDKRHSGSDWFDWIIHWDGASVGPPPHVLRIRRRALITSMLATCFMDRGEGCNPGAGNGSAGATEADRGGGERHHRVAQAISCLPPTSWFLNPNVN